MLISPELRSSYDLFGFKDSKRFARQLSFEKKKRQASFSKQGQEAATAAWLASADSAQGGGTGGKEGAEGRIHAGARIRHAKRGAGRVTRTEERGEERKEAADTEGGS